MSAFLEIFQDGTSGIPNKFFIKAKLRYAFGSARIISAIFVYSSSSLINKNISLDILDNTTAEGSIIFPAKSVYTCYVILKTSATFGQSSYTSNTVTAVTVTKPSVPTNLRASIVELVDPINSEFYIPNIKLEWDATSDWGGGTPGVYVIIYKSSDNPNIWRFRSINTGFPFYIFDDLPPEKTYTFRIAAENIEFPTNVTDLVTNSSAPSNSVYLPKRQYPTIQFKLFNRSSWNNRSDIPVKIKTQLNKAADRWEKYITINDTRLTRILSLRPSFIRGISLEQLTINNNPNMSAAACVRSEVVTVFDMDGLDKDGNPIRDGRGFFSKIAGVVTLGFRMRLNSHFFDTLTDGDWLLALTHHLGHALGLGSNPLFNELRIRPEDALIQKYPRFQLSETFFPNAQKAYNKMRFPPFVNIIKGRRFIPLDHLGPQTTDDIVGFDGTPNNADQFQPQNITFTGGQLNGLEIPTFHWGILKNSSSRFTSLHPTDHINHDIMGYRYPNQDKSISLLSIKALVDLGYSEKSPNDEEILRYNSLNPQPETTITNQQLCKNLGQNEDWGINFTPLNSESTPLEPTIIGEIYNDTIISFEGPNKTNQCIKWYCSESGCVEKHSLGVFNNAVGYDTEQICEDNCTDSAGTPYSYQFVFDVQSKTWKINE
jgi:hypothetical protein